MIQLEMIARVPVPGKYMSRSDFLKAETSLLCLNCEKEIAPDTQMCPHCRAPIIRRYCSGCHRLIPDHATLCPYCRAPSNLKPRFTTVSRIAALVVLISIVAILAAFYRNNSDLNTALAPQQRESSISKKAPGPKHPKQTVARPLSSTGKTVQPEPLTVLPQPNLEDEQQTENEKDQESFVHGQRLLQGKKLNRVGLQLLRQGRYEKASMIFKNAVNSFPPETKDTIYGEALFYLGYSLRMAGKPEKAIPVLKRALHFPDFRNKAARELQTVSLQVESDD